jgi:hypothetical protein
LLQACRRTWELNNPDWTIHCLDRRNVISFIDDCAVRTAIEDLDQTPQVRAEKIRIALLAQHGGVWADATTYCLRPLNEWLFDMLGSGFFAFANSIPGRVVSTWFLAAKPSNYIVERWSKITREYWEGRTDAHEYFWLNFVFAAECEKNPAVRLIWDNTPKISAAGPAYYLPHNAPLLLPLTELDKQVITAVRGPLLKLYHRLPPGEYPTGSVAEYLCKRVNV